MLKKYPPKNSPRAKNTVFDIHPRENFGWNRIRETVSLRRHIYRRHPILTSAGALALILVVVLTADTFLGHANTVHWYPGSCLGGWTNSANAAGAPELGSSSNPDEFNADNSAILDNSVSQIFCGNFSGDMPTDTAPEKITLDISWILKSVPGPAGISQSAPPEIVEENHSVPEILPVEAQPSESGSASQDASSADAESSTVSPNEDTTGNILPGDVSPVENSNPASEPAPTDQSAPSGDGPAPTDQSAPSGESAPASSDSSQGSDTSSDGPSSWLFNFIKSAFAQEAPQQETPQQEASPVSGDADNQNDPAVSNPSENISEEPIEESAENPAETAVSTSSDGAVDVANPENKSEDTPASVEQKNFLEARYSVDGETWHSLGFIGELNWHNAEIPIPPMSWEDLKNLQISLVSLPVSDTAPIVYLDGMSLKVDYTDVPLDPYPAPDPARGDIFVSQITYDTNTLVLVARPPVIHKIIEGPEPSSTVIVANEETTTLESTTTTIAIPENNEVAIEVTSTSVDDILNPDIQNTESTTTISRPVTADMIMELWVRDDVSIGWTRIAGPEIMAKNPMIRFEYGNIFWTGPDGNSIWRFNPSSKSYESISTSEDGPSTMRFADQAGGQQELILEDGNRVHFEEVKPEINGF